MNGVNLSKLRPVDTSQMADRPKLFVEAFGGWDTLEYMFWVERMKREYHIARGTVQYGFNGGRTRPEDCPIIDHDDFTEFLRGQVGT